MSEPAPAVNPAMIDAAYRPFRNFAEWMSVTLDGDRWKVSHDEILKQAGDDETILARAQEVAKRAAALETGAIEGLYALERGVTITIATQTAMWQAALAKQEKARGMIEAQLKAYDYVLDLATKARPITEAWIRELHSVLCSAQETYTVATSNGNEQRPLARGAYKTEPNHVLKGDGSVHPYAPVDQTSPEMARLVTELTSPQFTDAPPAVQAAFAHHTLTVIHPFADGNGRVARALASVFTYRAARVPLLVLSDGKQSYFDALEAADVGNFQPFSLIVNQCIQLALELVLQSLKLAKLPSPQEAARAARLVNRTKGELLHTEVDAIGMELLKEAFSILKEIQAPLLSANELSGRLKFGTLSQSGSPPKGCRAVKSQEAQHITCDFATPAPAEAKFPFSVQLFVPLDCGPEDEFCLICPELTRQLSIGVSELRPSIFLAAQFRLRMWMEEIITLALSELSGRGADALKQRGYR